MARLTSFQVAEIKRTLAESLPQPALGAALGELESCCQYPVYFEGVLREAYKEEQIIDEIKAVLWWCRKRASSWLSDTPSNSIERRTKKRNRTRLRRASAPPIEVLVAIALVSFASIALVNQIASLRKDVREEAAGTQTESENRLATMGIGTEGGQTSVRFERIHKSSRMSPESNR